MIDFKIYQVHRGKVKVRTCVGETDEHFRVRTASGFMRLLKKKRETCPLRRGGEVFNTVHVVLNEAEAFCLARIQVARYREWIARHVDIADALARDLT